MRRLSIALMFAMLQISLYAAYIGSVLEEQAKGSSELDGKSTFTVADYSPSGEHRKLSSSDISLLTSATGGWRLIYASTPLQLSATVLGSEVSLDITQVSESYLSFLGDFSQESLSRLVSGDGILVSKNFLGKTGLTTNSAIGTVVTIGEVNRYLITGVVPDTEIPPFAGGSDAWVVENDRELSGTPFMEDLPPDVERSIRRVRPNKSVVLVDTQGVGEAAISRYLDSVQADRQHLVTWQNEAGFSNTVGFRAGTASMKIFPGMIEDFEDLGKVEAVQKWVNTAGAVFLFATAFAFWFHVIDEVRRGSREFRILSVLGSPIRTILSRSINTNLRWGGAAIFCCTIILLYTDLPKADPLNLSSEEFGARGVLIAAGLSTLALVFLSLVTAVLVFRRKSSSSLVYGIQEPTAYSNLFRDTLGVGLVSAMVTATVALVLIVQDMSGFLNRSWGFETEGRTIVELQQTKAWDFSAAGPEFISMLDQSISNEAERISVALTGKLPPFYSPDIVEVHDWKDFDRSVSAIEISGSNDFFEVSGIEFVAGYSFAKAPEYGGVISNSLAEALFGSATNAIGAGIEIATPRENSRMYVTGVAEDIRGHKMVFYRNTDLPNGGQIWTNKLLVNSALPVDTIASRIGSVSKEFGYTPGKAYRLQSALAERVRPFIAAAVVIAGITLAMVVVAVLAITSHIASLLENKRQEILILWKIGASAFAIVSSAFRRVFVVGVAGIVVGVIASLVVIPPLTELSLVVSERESYSAIGKTALTVAITWFTLAALLTLRGIRNATQT